MRYVLICAACLSVTVVFGQADSIRDARIQVLRSADSLMGNYQFEKALQVLTQWGHEDKDFLLHIGQCNFRLGMSRAAIEPYERVLEIDSVNITALNQLGQLYGRDGDYGKAMFCYGVLLELDSTNTYYYKQSAWLATRLDQDLVARALYEKALSYNAADAESSVALGNILLDMEAYRAVDSLVGKALLHDPENKALHLVAAKSQLAQHHYSRVVNMVNELIEKNDSLVAFIRLLGASYFQLGEYSKVKTCMEFMTARKYDSDWIYYYLGVASRELGDTPASVGYFKKAVELSVSENTGTYYSQLGRSFEELNDYPSAIRAYRAAYNTSKEGILLYHLARNYDVYYKDKSQALTYYKKYLESDDTIRLAKEYSRKRVQAIGR